MPPIHRGDLVYVAYQPGDKPNVLRSWPQVHEQNYVGSAPEGAAMQIAKATTVPVIVNGKRANYANPYTESGGAIQWWYVRSFQGDPAASRGQVLNAWTAGYGPLGGQRKEFLLPLAQRLYACDEPQQAPLKSYLAAGKRAYVPTGKLQLLSGPGGGYELMGQLTAGDTLTVLGKPACDHHSRLWWQTDHHGWWACEAEQVEKGLKLNLLPLTV